jgi:CubicO group peptidase (beta-lactamase class C family)
MKKKLRLSVLALTLLLTGCGQQAAPYAYQVPEELDDGWETADLADVGMDPDPLCNLIDRINRKEYQNVHGILIVKDGKLVFEEYFDGYAFSYSGPWSSLLKFRGKRVEFDANTPHNLASVTKSITSALVGIALDRGYLRGLDEPVFNYFPQYAHLRTKDKDRITVEHLLTMTSGLEWNELELWLGDMDHDLIRLFIVPDPVQFVLAKPLVDEPGTRWYYMGGGVNVLGEALREASGLRLDDFAQRYLFTPLGITEVEWDFINSDTIHASGNLKLRPRDAAKFGYLYLNDGRWQGQQILSREWIAASTRESVSIPWSSLAGNLHEQYADVPEPMATAMGIYGG